MPTSRSPVSAASFATFGELLRYLRARARITQREFAIAVGYSEAQISRLEGNHRPPDLAAVAALFVPALELQGEPELVARLFELAAQARGEALPAHLSITRTVRHELRSAVDERATVTLPVPRTSFVGRERETAAVVRALAQSRLVTLAGAGGSGKTRLAIHVATQMAASFVDGVCFVALAPLADPALVPTEVATALDLPAREGSVVDAVANVLRPRRLLLVLDNCEHLAEAAAQLADALLRACPRLCLLTTSREPLHTIDELVYRLAPLDLPGRAATSHAAIVSSPSVQLFIERARVALPGFVVSDENARDVALICRRLDGMPLAIELAASRLSLLTSRQISERLDDRFRLLTAAKRAEPRHQSLRLALDWSYELLDPDERALFARLSVFSGGWSVEAMEQICGSSGVAPGKSAADHAPHALLNLLEQLINKSLIIVERHGDTPARFGMLETLREYAREKLDAAGETAALRERHLRHFVSFFEQAEPHTHRAEQMAWLEIIDANHDNVRAALGFVCERADPAALEIGYRLILALAHYWHVRGLSAEAQAWTARLLAAPNQPVRSALRARARASSALWSPPEQAQALLDESAALLRDLGDQQGLAYVYLQQGLLGWASVDGAQAHGAFRESLAGYRAASDEPMLVRLLAELAEFEQVRLDDRVSAKAHFTESLQRARALGDIRSIALALAHLGDLAMEQGDVATAQAYCAEALSLSAELGDQEAMSWSLNGLSCAALGRGQATQAIELGEESLRLSLEWSSASHVAIRRYWLARAVLQAGDVARATTLFEENAAHSHELQFDWGEAVSLQGLGDLALAQGEMRLARSHQQCALALLRAGSYGYSLAYSLDSFAAISAAESAWQHAALLLGAADALRERIDTALLPIERVGRELLIAQITEQLGEAMFEQTRAKGRALPLDEAALSC